MNSIGRIVSNYNNVLCYNSTTKMLCMCSLLDNFNDPVVQPIDFERIYDSEKRRYMLKKSVNEYLGVISDKRTTIIRLLPSNAWGKWNEGPLLMQGIIEHIEVLTVVADETWEFQEMLLL